MAVALHIHLEAKPGKEAEVVRLLQDIRACVEQEPATSSWCGVRMTDTVFGIFDTFPDEAGREAHLNGKGAALLKQRQDDLLTQPARIDRLDVLASKG
jgi:quinol monooxygenase YgiN